MSIRKPAIPSVNTQDRSLKMALDAIQENIEIITGARANIRTLTQLPATATTAQIVSKINEVIARLNVTGQ